MTQVDKIEPRSLYVRRDVLNTEAILSWAKEQGFVSIVPPESLHVTIIYSKTPVDWTKIGDAWALNEDGTHTVKPGGPRSIEQFNQRALVLAFADNYLQSRNHFAREAGATSNFPDYIPHITLSYREQPIDLEKIIPYRGEIVLGPEIFEEIKESFDGDSLSEQALKILKIDEMERIVFGWGSVISENGVPLVDLQDHVIEAGELLKATTDFMLSTRKSLNMHAGRQVGTVVHSFPLTKEIAASLGVQSNLEGWIVGVKIHDEEIWKKVVSRDLRGFSIGATAKLQEI